MKVSHSNPVHSCPVQPTSQTKTSKSWLKGFFNKKSEKSAPPIDQQRIRLSSATKDPLSSTELYKREGNRYFNPDRHSIYLRDFEKIKPNKRLEAFKQVLEAADLFDCYILSIYELFTDPKNPSLEMAKAIIQKFKVNPKFTLQVSSRRDYYFFKEVFAKEGYHPDQLLVTTIPISYALTHYDFRFNHDFKPASQSAQRVKSEKSAPPIDRHRVSKVLDATEDPPSSTELYKTEGNRYFYPESHNIWLRLEEIKPDKRLETFKQILEAADLFDCYILCMYISDQLTDPKNPSLEMAKAIIQKFKVNPKFTLRTSSLDLNFFKEVFAKEGYHPDQLIVTAAPSSYVKAYDCKFNHDFKPVSQSAQRISQPSAVASPPLANRQGNFPLPARPQPSKNSPQVSSNRSLADKKLQQSPQTEIDLSSFNGTPESLRKILVAARNSPSYELCFRPSTAPLADIVVDEMSKNPRLTVFFDNEESLDAIKGALIRARYLPTCIMKSKKVFNDGRFEYEITSNPDGFLRYQRIDKHRGYGDLPFLSQTMVNQLKSVGDYPLTLKEGFEIDEPHADEDFIKLPWSHINIMSDEEWAKAKLTGSPPFKEYARWLENLCQAIASGQHHKRALFLGL